MVTHKTTTLLALLGLVCLTLIFFWKILLTNLILSGVDIFLYFYPYKAYAAEALRQGRLPLWNPHLFMGAPLLANSQVGLFYPLNWPLIWLTPPKQVAWSIGLHVALAGSFTFLLARISLKLQGPAAFIAASLFAFGGYLSAQVEHINQLQAAAWLPLLFLLYDAAMDTPQTTRRWLFTLLLAATIALMLLAGHTQTVFISMVGLGLYAVTSSQMSVVSRQMLADNHKNPARKKSGDWRLATGYPLKRGIRNLFIYLWPLAVASLLAVAAAAVQLLPTAELSSLSIRSEGLTFREVVSFSLRPTALHFSLLPPLALDLTQILGQAFSEWVAYLGLTGLALALLGGLLSIWQAPARRFVFLSAAGLILSLGLYSGPLYAALYYVVPGFGLFRVPARWLLLYGFGAAILAGYGFQALLTPAATCAHLATLRGWLARWRWGWGLIALPGLFLLALILWKTPPLLTLLAWAGLAALAAGLIALTLREQPPAWALPALTLLLLIELFGAAQSLNYNQPTAPQAYSSMRNSTAFLLAADPPHQAAPPGRFLSLSGITYDPGDLADLQNIFGDHLSEQALYNLIVATKEKEVLFFNLPLLYGLHSVDGYDGGILPLQQFVTFQKLFLPEDDLSRDGRLREKLRFVPANWLLSLTNTRWIITDKQFDAWIDGIFYDLQFPARLRPGDSIATADIPDFPPTAIGLVSHLEGGDTVTAGAPVAAVTITFASGQQERLTLVAGDDTAEGSYGAGVQHPQAAIGVTWPYEGGGVDYISVKPLPAAGQVSRIEVEALLPAGEFVLRGLSLIHQPTTTSRSVLLSTEGDYAQVHSGDVKVYENRAALPRVFVVHQAQLVADEDEAIAAMTAVDFDARQTLVRLTGAGEAAGLVSRGTPNQADRADIVAYAPERVEIATSLATPGWLVLADSYYPGWQATIDGQPAAVTPVNLLFRSVAVPAGEHTVIFEFKPASVYGGALVSGVSLLGLVVGLMVLARRRG